MGNDLEQKKYEQAPKIQEQFEQAQKMTRTKNNRSWSSNTN